MYVWEAWPWVCLGEWHPGADTGMESRGHWTRSHRVPDLLPSLLSTREEEEEEKEEGEEEEVEETMLQVKENENV